MAPEIHDSHSIPDWRFWNGTESDRRYILQVQWRQDSCEMDFPRGKLEKGAEREGGGVGREARKRTWGIEGGECKG